MHGARNPTGGQFEVSVGRRSYANSAHLPVRRSKSKPGNSEVGSLDLTRTFYGISPSHLRVHKMPDRWQRPFTSYCLNYSNFKGVSCFTCAHMLGEEKEHRRMSVEDEMRRSLWYEHNEFCRKLLSNELEKIIHNGSLSC